MGTGPRRYIIADGFPFCKYYFQKNQKIFSFPTKTGIGSPKLGVFTAPTLKLPIPASKCPYFMPGNPAIIRLYLHQNDVRTNAADAIPGNAVIIPPPPKAQDPAWPRHQDGSHAPVRDLHLYIRNEP